MIFYKRVGLHKKLAAVLAVTMLCCLVGCASAEGEVSSMPPVSSAAHHGSAARAAKVPDVADANIEATEPGESEAPKEPEELELSWAETKIAVPIYAKPEPGEAIAQTEPGQDFTYNETDDPMWYEVTLSNGTTGFVYGEYLFRPDENSATSASSLAEETLQSRLSLLMQKLPEGKYWNHAGQYLDWGEESPFAVTDTPCDHSGYGYIYCNYYNGTTSDFFSYDALCQCLGFASLLSDQLFGQNAPVHIFYDPDLLRVGDHIRLGEYEHSMTVIELTEDYVTLGEVNRNYEDCRISWSRQMTLYELYELDWDAEYLSRYPLCPNGDGTFAEWDD